MLHPTQPVPRRLPTARRPALILPAWPPRGSHLGALLRVPLLAGLLLCALLPLASPASAQTAMQAYVEAMQPGTNWGNTLDAIPDRHSWGAPETTQAMIQGLVNKGYKSLRLPITWSNYMGPAPDYTLDAAFMNHVQQVVDWSLAAGLHVMINLHHDSWTWMDDMPAHPEATLDRFRKVWSQIASRFKDYPDRLLFESVNEPGFEGLDDAAMAAMLHDVNTAFVQLIRGTGGGNATRPLVLPTVFTRSDQPMLDALKRTITGLNDPNLIATVHYYGWYPFSVNLGGYTKFDATSRDWVHTPLDAAYDTFVAAGIPVIVGEFSVLSGSWIQRGEQLKYHEYVQAYGRAKGMTMMLWDTGGIYGRHSADWANPDLGNIMMQAVTGRAITAESDLLFVKAGTPVGDRVFGLNLNGNRLVAVEDNGTTLTPGLDYTLDGEALTLKAHVLAKYATGGFGEKATLKLHANTGPAWKVFVRFCDTPVPAPVTTTTKVAFSLPVAFNGDLLATMESRHEDGSNVGPINWTSFQQFGAAFRPNYGNNTIEFDREFLEHAPPGRVTLDLHFWSGKVLRYRLDIVERSTEGGTESVIYDDALGFGWYSWSWMPYDTGSTVQAHSGSKSISFSPTAWGGVVLQTWAPADTSAFRTLTFWIHGGTTGGQQIGIGPIRGDVWGPGSYALPVPVANEWTKVEVPLSGLGVEGSPDLTGFYFQHWRGESGPTFHIDDIRLTTALTTAVMDIHGTPAPVITSTTKAGGQYGVPFRYTISAVNAPVTFSATSLPAGLTVDADTGVISGSPQAAGSYVVTLGATNAAGTNTETLNLDIAPAPVVFEPAGGGSFGTAIVAPYDGSPRPVDVRTSPAGIPVAVSYNGSTAAPTLPGTYHVVVTSHDPNYAGAAEGTLVITVTALVRHAPTLNGDLDGSLQLLAGESFSVNGSGSVSGDLLVPGLPAVSLNGSPLFAGVVDAGGVAEPANYGITLNSGSVVRTVVRRVDPIAMPAVTAPAPPTGTRDVMLSNASQNPGSFATIRHLTLNGNAGAVAVPAGVYGHLTVNGTGGLVFGVAGAVEPARYELQSLTLNGRATVEIAGPVRLKLARGLTLSGAVGSAGHPDWLQIEISDGGLTLNGNAVVHGLVTAPNGHVVLNGILHGRVSADRLTINGGGALEDPAP